MTLKALAQSDLNFILADNLTGFAEPIRLISPQGVEFLLQGFTTDISATIDPDTGAVISSRKASVAIRMSDIKLNNIEIPHRQHNESVKPWQILFTDAVGDQHRYSVRESIPDRALGCIVLMLEAYEL